MKFKHCLAVSILIASTLAQAQMAADMKMPAPAKGPASMPHASPRVMTEGVVQSVDAAKGFVTLKHGAITNMQMPAMTMAFGVADKKMLAPLKSGDRVKFQVESVNNVPTVTRIEPAR